MAESDSVSKEGVNRIEARLSAEIKELNTHVKQNSLAIAKLETLYSTLVKLPDAIAALEKTVVGVNHNLESMNIRIGQINENVEIQKASIKALHEENQRQNENIAEVDNKSKVDWARFLTGNFWSLLFKAIMGVAAVIVAYQAITGGT